jgi:dTDP-glucose 4,6-dehydratase
MKWNGKRVLVTGAGGFIGSHLAERLVELGATTRALVHYRSNGSWGWLDQSVARDEIEVVAGDLCDRESVEEAMAGVEIVFHLAALIAIPYSYHVPSSFVRTNVAGTLNILQAAKDLGIERLIHTSTSEVYGTAQYVPINEAHPLQAQSPYSASKIGADKVAESFFLSFGLPVVTVRPFNTFGPRQSARAIVPTIITQCLTDAKVRLGNLDPTRDLSYVSDTVEGFVRAAECPGAVGRTVNIGSGREIRIEALATLVAELAGKRIVIEQEEERVRPQGSEVDRLLADNALARELLGWTPSVSLEQGLRATIEWMREHLDAYRAGAYVL